MSALVPQASHRTERIGTALLRVRSPTSSRTSINRDAATFRLDSVFVRQVRWYRRIPKMCPGVIAPVSRQIYAPTCLRRAQREKTVPCGATRPVNPCGHVLPVRSMPECVAPGSRKRVSIDNAPLAGLKSTTNRRFDLASPAELSTTRRPVPSIAIQCGRSSFPKETVDTSRGRAGSEMSNATSAWASGTV